MYHISTAPLRDRHIETIVQIVRHGHDWKEDVIYTRHVAPQRRFGLHFPLKLRSNETGVACGVGNGLGIAWTTATTVTLISGRRWNWTSSASRDGYLEAI
jgi:hypothetical protein